MKTYVNKYRLEKDLSLTELSKKSGVALSYIYNIEQGNSTPTITVM